MKRYATYKTTDIRYGGAMHVCDSMGLAPHKTLDEHVRDGWRVVASAVQTSNCGHESTQFVFILERDNSPDSGPEKP